MEMHPLPPEVRTSSTRSVTAQGRLEITSMEISTMPKKRREPTDEELELIDMRYEQALASLNLEILFAEGLFNGR
jgi:hypothetical protein